MPVPTFEFVPNVEDPKDDDALNVVLLAALPNKPPGFCCPNKVEPPPSVKPVFVPSPVDGAAVEPKENPPGVCTAGLKEVLNNDAPVF